MSKSMSGCASGCSSSSTVASYPFASAASTSSRVAPNPARRSRCAIKSTPVSSLTGVSIAIVSYPLSGQRGLLCRLADPVQTAATQQLARQRMPDDILGQGGALDQLVDAHPGLDPHLLAHERQV